MRLSAVLPNLLQAAQRTYGPCGVRAISAHGLLPDGSVEASTGLWFALVATAEGALGAVAWEGGAVHAVAQPPVPVSAVPTVNLRVEGLPCSRVYSEHFCGLAGWDALAGRPDDSLWLGHRDGVGVVAVLSGTGGATAVLNAAQPHVVVAMDFVPAATPRAQA